MSDGEGERPLLADVVEHWPVLSTEDLYRDGWVVALRADRVATPDGEATMRRLVLEHPGAAVILAVDEQHRVFCLWQYRHPTGRRFVELPAGLCDGESGETPLEVAVRELREEAQLRAATWTHLISSHCSPGISEEVHHLFLARDLSPCDRGDFELHHEELDMTSAWVPFEDLHAAVLTGSVTDGPLVQAVLVARSRGLV